MLEVNARPIGILQKFLIKHSSKFRISMSAFITDFIPYLYHTLYRRKMLSIVDYRLSVKLDSKSILLMTTEKI